MAVTVFIDEIARSSLSKAERESLKENFITYKSGNAARALGLSANHQSFHPAFGKDEPLTQPEVARGILFKIHMKPTVKADIKEWDRRLSSGRAPVSDDILIYTQGVTQTDHYLILDILRPKGHEKMLNLDRMAALAEMAKVFHENH